MLTIEITTRFDLHGWCPYIRIIGGYMHLYHNAARIWVYTGPKFDYYGLALSGET